MIGTPAYMIKEKAAMIEFDVDTRSDVYSLGVLLYELLTGSPPFDAETLQSAGFDEMRRIIREEIPSKPSTRLSTMAGELRRSVASHRHSSPQELKKQCDGELDWIVMKALEKERTRRYETAIGLACDVERFLNDEAVAAGPPSAGYRIRKFVRRNRSAVAAAAIITVLLVGGISTSTWFALREKAQRTLAEIELGKAEAVSNFVNQMLSSVEPQVAKGMDRRLLIMILNDGAKRIASLDDQPEIQARLHGTIGNAYYAIGLYPNAEPHLESSLKLHRKICGKEHLDTLVSMGCLGCLYRDQGQLEKAEPLLTQSLELSKRLLGEEHHYTFTWMDNLAQLYKAQGHVEKAESLYTQTLALRKRLLGEEHPHTLISMYNLAKLYKAQGHAEKAEPLFAQTLELRLRILGEEHPHTLNSMNNLAQLYIAQRRPEKAEPLLTQTLELRKRILGEEHINTLKSMHNLAKLYKAQGHPEKAEPLLTQTLGIMKRIFGEDHLMTLGSMNTLALVYAAQGHYEKARILLTEALSIAKRTLGEEHPGVGQIQRHLDSLPTSEMP